MKIIFGGALAKKFLSRFRIPLRSLDGTLGQEKVLLQIMLYIVGLDSF